MKMSRLFGEQFSTTLFPRSEIFHFPLFFKDELDKKRGMGTNQKGEWVQIKQIKKMYCFY